MTIEFEEYKNNCDEFFQLIEPLQSKYHTRVVASVFCDILVQLTLNQPRPKEAAIELLNLLKLLLKNEGVEI